MQSSCESALHLERNDIFTIKTFLAEAKKVYDPTKPASAQTIAFLLGNTLKSLATLAERSSSGVFTLTPDTGCSDFLR